MRQKTYWHRIVWCLALASILAVSIWFIGPLPAAGQSLGEYFQISYDPVSFSKNEINGSEVFQATIKGRVTCIQDLPAPLGEASVTSSVIAEHTESGTGVTLNSSYTLTIKPIPYKEGDTAEINQVVSLKFPAQAESGNYNVIGKLIEVKVKVGFGWLDITEYLPQDQLMGSLKYTAPESKPTPEPSPVPTPTSTPVPSQTPVSPEYGIPWWVWLIVAIAVATTMMNVIWFLLHRA